MSCARCRRIRSAVVNTAAKTLTDREIAILHLALKSSAGYPTPPSAAEFDETRAQIDLCEALSGDDECLFRALAMAPLYRHAFGIEAPVSPSALAVAGSAYEEQLDVSRIGGKWRHRKRAHGDSPHEPWREGRATDD